VNPSEDTDTVFRIVYGLFLKGMFRLLYLFTAFDIKDLLDVLMSNPAAMKQSKPAERKVA
jgi:hypothetical protein